jgi:hypothetical protein
MSSSTDSKHPPVLQLVLETFQATRAEIARKTGRRSARVQANACGEEFPEEPKTGVTALPSVLATAGGPALASSPALDGSTKPSGK